MNSRKLFFMAFLLIGLCLGSVPPAACTLAADAPPDTVEGMFTVVYGDPDKQNEPQTLFYLTNAQGATYPLVVTPHVLTSAGGLLALNNQWVQVRLANGGHKNAQGRYTVAAITRLDPARSPISIRSRHLSGPQTMATLLCKFSNVADEPRSVDYFHGLYSNEFPGLDNFWREVSYGQINMGDSASAIYGWYVLPHPRNYYENLNLEQKLDHLMNDCLAAADADVYFPNYVGINMMFNDYINGALGWGGTRVLTLDGQTKTWGMTWISMPGYEDVTETAQQIGLALGLPRSRGGDGQVYTNQWDIMSANRAACASFQDPIYGCYGIHTIAFHKDLMGWIPENLKAEVPYQPSGSPPPLFYPQDAPLLYLRIPIHGSETHYYTVEARTFSGYDIGVYATAVVIHEVDTTREAPAQLIRGPEDNNLDDEESAWRVGETFQSTEDEVTITVLDLDDRRFQVQVTNGTQQATVWLMPLGIAQPFVDVTRFHWASDAINTLYRAHLIHGYPDNTYRPDAPATRAEMAVLLERGIHYPDVRFTPPPVDTPPFPDTAGHWAEAWIAALRNDGLTHGYPDGTYRPNANVTRAEMAVFLLHALHGATYSPPPATGETFPDVPANYWGAAWIEELAREGLTSGYPDGNYYPERPVSRAEIAAFLSRTFLEDSKMCDLFVAPDGALAGYTAGRSIDNPIASIAFGAARVRPGETVCVRGGSYSEKIEIRHRGYFKQPLTIRNFPNETPVIDATNVWINADHELNPLLLITRPYVIFEGFEIANYSTSWENYVPIGVLITELAHHVTIRNNVIHDIAHTGTDPETANAHGLAVFGASADQPIHDIRIEDNTFYNLTLGASEAVVFNGNVTDWQVVHNVIHDVNNIAVDAIGFEGMAEANDQARHGLIADNDIYNVDASDNPVYNGEGSAACVYVDGGADIVIERNRLHACNIGAELASEHAGHFTENVTLRNNFIYDNTEAGIAMGGYDTQRGGTAFCQVLNNTLFHNNVSDDWGGELYLQYNLVNNAIENNLIVAGDAGWLIRSWSDAMTDNVLDYNLFFASAGNPGWEWQGTEYTDFAAYRQASNNDAHSLNATDPLLVAPFQGDLHLEANSPAIDAGTAAAGVGDTDFDGDPRIQGDQVDIGADEAR